LRFKRARRIDTDVLLNDPNIATCILNDNTPAAVAAPAAFAAAATTAAASAVVPFTGWTTQH
jgi:hypothetical protein